ncbi:tetratricopeptide repeat protein [Ectopseudomonas oleovorans]|uniref:Tetratricopeptide repeat protein 38 n=1 Tax=Ectopseudomonas oleovorans TaxID=301 RepID=A0A3D9EVB9_ECTOL|nr:tetratricopeptide repeat protein [Pseudomonas oleovorans]RED07122.1 hypothetical protein DFO60_1633 [Pseudomonas oleovorans]
MPLSCTDRYDHPLSTPSAHAAERYQAGVDLLLSLWPGAAEALDEAIAADPDFALALAARARLQLIDNQAGAARETIARAQRLVERLGTERERSHVEVLRRLIAGEGARALQGALEHAERWPRDILILGLPLGAFGLLAFSGRADHDQARVDLCERHARHFAADDWWFLTYRGWSHGENGDVVRGRVLTERALELRRHNVNAAHALTHVLHESGDSQATQALIAGWLPEYPRHGTLHGHIAWHGALVALEQGDSQGALDLYQRFVAPAASTAGPLNRVSDNASFLWRLGLYGHEVPAELWQAAGPVVPLLCRALLAFAEEDYPGCARLLEPLRGDVARIGGSGAQREVIEDTLLVALMRAGEHAKALALLDGRLHRRSSRRDEQWRTALESRKRDR